MNPKWSSILGLILDIAGAVYLARGLIISKARAIELSISRIAGRTDEENLRHPQVQDRLRQSRNAVVGVVLLVVGAIFQIIGNWPR